MLKEYVRRGKKEKWADKPGSDFRKGSSAEIGVCSRPVWGSAYGGKSAKRPPWKSWILWWIFAVDFFGRKMQKKNPPKKTAGKSASRKQKLRRRTTSSKSASQTQKSAAKPTNKSACQTSKFTQQGFFD